MSGSLEAIEPQSPRRSFARLPTIFRIALRELRGGLSGFGIFLACIALGVAAIVGVASISRGFSDGLAREGRTILGGDASFALIHREISPAERDWLSARGSISAVATLRAMARRLDGTSALIDVKAVDATWPSQGAAVVKPDRPLAELLARRDGVYGVVADAALAARLDLSMGDRVQIGDSAFALRGTLVSEPDTLAGGLALGPRVIMTQDALRTTGLLQPGSLVRWIYRVTLHGSPDQPVSDAQVEAFTRAAAAAFPAAGWEVRTRNNVSPQFEKSLEQLTEFLTLVGLTALIVGGVGVANAVRSFVERKRADFATFKSLGATGGAVFALALMQVMAISGLGVALGLLFGALMPYATAWGFGELIPLPFIPALYPSQLAAGAMYGFLTALAFSIAPLGRAHDVPVSALFRDRVEPDRILPRIRYLVFTGAAAAALVSAMILLASDRRIAWIYIVATVFGFALLRMVAWLMMTVARRAPRVRSTELRLALSNIHRPGALTPSIVLSLGLGLALLVALTFIDGNLRREIGKAIPGETPSLFFLDVPSVQTPAFRSFVLSHAPSAKLEEVPLMRGRLVRLNNVPAEKVKASEEAAWVLEGDRGITFASRPPDGSIVTEGAWWAPGYAGPPLVSMDAKIAKGLGLKLGDMITVNVLGRDVTAKIANLRQVNWRTLGINFVFVFSPNAFAGAPHTTLATATFPGDGDANRDLVLLRDVAKAYPAVTTIRVKDALDAVNSLLDKIALAIRSASGIALAASVLVLAGALASSQRNRVYDAVVLKTLGATRWRLLYALLLEYAILGSATAIFGVIAGGLAAWAILTTVMKIEAFVWLWGQAAIVALAGLVVTVGLGLLGTYRILGQKPAPYLRDL